MNSNPKLASRVYPVSISLPPDEKNGWRPYHIFNGPTTALQSLSCHVSVLIKGHIPHPPHKHREEEILMLLSGEADVIIQKEGPGNECRPKRLKLGQFVYYPAYFEAFGPALVT